MFWELLLTATVIWILYYRWQRRKLYKIADEIPSGIRAFPVVGHAYLFSGSDEDRMNGIQLVGRKAIENGGLSTMWMVNYLYLVVADPEAAETIMKTSIEKNERTITFIRTVIGNGSIFARANIWRPRRKILAPIFSLKNLNQFVTVFDRQSTVMATLLAPMAGTGDFSVWKYITTFTFDSICETTLDIHLNAQSNPDLPFLTAFDKLLHMISQRIGTPWMYPDFVYKNIACYKQFLAARQVVWDFVDELIQEKQKLYNESDSPEQDNEEPRLKTFLEMMMEQSGKGNTGYTDLELREEAMVILFAGTDTSAVGAAFTTVMLSRYPDVQEKVYQELQEVFGNSNRPLTMEDLPKLKYLEVVIKETLRLYPAVPITGRDVHDDVELPTGTIVCNGTEVMLNIWAIHRNPKYWGKDAELFRPERFLEISLLHPAQYQPFSYWTRNCLGLNYAMMSMKTVLANLLRRYKILPPQNLDPMMLKEPLRVKYDIMMKHVDDYKVRLVMRDCLI